MKNNENLLNDLQRGNPDLPKGEVPQEFFERPDEVDADCPYDATTFLAGANGEAMVGETSELGRVIVAGSGGGKTVELIAEAIKYKGSMMILDPKGSVAKATAQWRAKGGQNYE